MSKISDVLANQIIEFLSQLENQQNVICFVSNPIVVVYGGKNMNITTIIGLHCKNPSLYRWMHI